MKRAVLSFLFLSLSIFAGPKEFIEKLQSHEKTLRVTSKEFKDLQSELKDFSNEQLSELINKDLKGKQLKNLLALISRIEDKKAAFKLLIDKALSSENNKALYSYFAYIVYDPDYLEDYKEKFSKLKDIKPFLTVLDSKSSSAAFEIILNFHSAGNDLTESLLNTVHEENTDTVLKLFNTNKKLGHKLAAKLLMIEVDTVSADTALLMLKTRKSQKKKVYTAEEINELVQLYSQLDEDSFQEIAAQILSEQYSVELNHKCRNKLDLNSELISQVFLAKALSFNFKAYKKYKNYIPSLHSSEIKDRLKSLLELRDFADPLLAHTFLHLLNDPASDIRRDSLDCLTALVEKNQSAMTAFLPIKENKRSVGPDEMPELGKGPTAVQENNINKVILLLNDPAPAVTVAAIELLTHVNNEAANKQIALLLSSTNQHILLAAIASVEKNEVADGLLKLIDLLKHRSWQVRARAAKAINEFDNKGQYLSILEKLFFKEKDQFVRNNIFNFLTTTTNEKIFDYLRDRAKNAKSPVDKYESLVQLLKLKNIPISEVERLRTVFHKFEDSEFSDTWLRVAGNKKLDINKEITLVFSKGTPSNKEQAIWVAGRQGIDITPYLTEQAYREISYSDLFYYLRSNKLLEIEPKLKILNAIFGDPDFPEYTKALERLQRSIRNDLNLNDDERIKVNNLLKSIKPKASKIAQTMISVILNEKIPNDEIDRLMEAYKDPDKQSEVAPAVKLLVKKFTTEQVKKYENQLTSMLLNNAFYPYELSGKLSEFSLENLQNLYDNGGNYRYRYLKPLATKLPLKEIIRLSKDLKGSRYVSQYEIYEAIGKAVPSMKAEDLKAFLESIEDGGRNSMWELAELIEKIPNLVKIAGLKMYKEGKLEASPNLFYIICNNFTTKEFDTFYKFLSETKIDTQIFSYGNSRPSLTHLSNLIIDKIENTKIDFRSLKFFENALALSNNGGLLSRKVSISSLEKQVPSLDSKYYGRVFEILENSGSKSEVYYDLYAKLLEGKVDPVIFKQQAATNTNRFRYQSFTNVKRASSGTSLLKKLFTKKDKSEEFKGKVIKKLIELKNNHEGAKLKVIAMRLSKLVDANSYIQNLNKRFKSYPTLISYLPEGEVSSDSFKLLKENINLKLVPLRTAMNTGKSLSSSLAKELIKEYRENPDSGLWPFIIQKLGPSETDIILSKMLVLLEDLRESIYNGNQSQISSQIRILIKKLSEPAVNKQIDNYLTANLDNIEKVYALALLNVKVPGKTLNNFLKINNLTDSHKEMIINTFYINKIYNKEVFAFHETYLGKLKGKQLAEAIKLSPEYHHGNEERRGGSYSSDNMTIRQAISFSGLSYSGRFGGVEENSKPKIPKEADLAYKSLKAKKLAVYKLANDPGLIQYVADKDALTLAMTIQQLKADLDELSGPLLESLNSQLKKASNEELKEFLDLMGQKDIYLRGDYDTDYFEGLDEKQLTYLKSYLDQTKFDNVKNFLSPIHIKMLKTDKDFDKLAKRLLEPGSSQMYNELHLLQPVMAKFKLALFRYIEKNELKDQQSAGMLAYALSQAELTDAELKSLDNKLPNLNEKVQRQFIGIIYQQGPYYPNALKAHLELLEKSPNPNNVNMDLMYLYYEETLDTKKVEPVKDLFDKVQRKSSRFIRNLTTQN